MSSESKLRRSVEITAKVADSAAAAASATEAFIRKYFKSYEEAMRSSGDDHYDPRIHI